MRERTARTSAEALRCTPMPLWAEPRPGACEDSAHSEVHSWAQMAEGTIVLEQLDDLAVAAASLLATGALQGVGDEAARAAAHIFLFAW